MSYTSYVGRFAPSPTGPLHFGSLVAAVASYLDARANKGRWLIRMDDIDPPREVDGAADDILATLQGFGFVWDNEVIYQSKQHSSYQAALNTLIEQNLAYPCICSRKQILQADIQGLEGPIYPGTCRRRSFKSVSQQSDPGQYSVRLKTGAAQTILFTDQLQGQQQQNLTTDIGDFVLNRADNYWSYQLANVVDDANMGITHVVRGVDLLDSTARQIHLQNLLNLPSIHYAHIPVVSGPDGNKLAKGNGAQAVKPIAMTLWESLTFLNQSPPVALRTATLADIWHWATRHWSLQSISRTPWQAAT